MRYWLLLYAKTIETGSLPYPANECQQSINGIWSCILGNLTGDWLQTAISQVLAAFGGKNNGDVLPAPSWKWASTER